MRKLPLILTASLALGLTVGATGLAGSHTPDPAPSVTWSAPPVLTQALACQEDDPCWDCHSLGNRVCGPASPEESAAAWAAWDYSHGNRSLKVDPSRAYKVEYVGSALDTPRSLADNEAAIVGKDGKWYVFRAAYTG